MIVDDLIFWALIAGITAVVFAFLLKVMILPFKILKYVIVIIVPMTTLILYNHFGSANFSDLVQMVKPNDEALRAVQKIEQQVQAGASADGSLDLQLLIAFYDKTKNYPKLVQWLGEYVKANPDNLSMMSKWIEARILEQDGSISAETASDLKKVFELTDKSDERMAYYLALYHAQKGDNRKAIAILRQIIQKMHADDPFIADMVQALKLLAQEEKLDFDSIVPKPLPPK